MGTRNWSIRGERLFELIRDISDIPIKGKYMGVFIEENEVTFKVYEGGDIKKSEIPADIAIRGGKADLEEKIDRLLRDMKDVLKEVKEWRVNYSKLCQEQMIEERR